MPCTCKTCEETRPAEVKHNCQAAEFERHVKLSHYVPQDPEKWKKMHVRTVVLTRTHGIYKSVAFDFDDDSSYEERRVHCGCYD